MPRPRRDGTKARPPNRRALTEFHINGLKPEASAYAVWDVKQRGLAIVVQKSGHRSWKCVYSLRGRGSRWYHIGDARAIGLADARRLAAKVMLQVAEGKDPHVERIVARGAGTFEELAVKYAEQAKKKNKSWQQADALVRKHLVPKWGKVRSPDVTRQDVKAMMSSISAPIVANQVLASASAIFSWAVKQEIVAANPCVGVDRNKTRKRERVLSDSEIPKFWRAFDSAGLACSALLKLILLLGQRPGEVLHMRREHIEDGWWNLPGVPVEELDWPGVKNAENHRVWLPAPARDILAELEGGLGKTGAVFSRTLRADTAMRGVVKQLGAVRATPHDLRRTHGTLICSLGFGRDAMNRVQNHKEGGIGSVYDRHDYGAENRRVMEAVAARIMDLVEGKETGNVVTLRRAEG